MPLRARARDSWRCPVPASELVCLKGGMVVPLAALTVLLAAEDRGYRLAVDGDDLIVTAEPGNPLDRQILAALKAWKAHVRMLLTFTLDDSPPQSDGAPLTPVPRRQRRHAS